MLNARINRSRLCGEARATFGYHAVVTGDELPERVFCAPNRTTKSGCW